MPFESLGEYIEALEEAGELKRIKTQVNPELEIAEIMRRLMYARNQPAVLFERVEGYDIPVLGNAFGTTRRLQIALGVEDFSEIGNRIVDLTRLTVPSGMLNKIRMLPKLSGISDFAPKVVDTGPIKEVIETQYADLESLPNLKSFPKDAGRFVTFGVTVTRHPSTGVRNLGVYRIQIIDDKHALMHWQIHKRGAQHYEIKKEHGGPIEVAIIIGADPATILAAVSPVPEGMDKFFFSGIMRKKGVKLVKCSTVDLEVPANSEIVLEGHVNSNDLRMEGPFGDHTGYYTPPEPFPTFTLTGLMKRKKATYLTTVVGKPILEDAYIGNVVERSFLPLIQLLQPEVVDFTMPAAGWFQGLAVISIKKRYPGQAKKVMMGLWGTGQLALTKIFVIVDHDINVHNVDEVIWAVTTRVDPKRDTVIIDNAPTDTLDPASPMINLGSKLGIDATTKWLEEGYTREVQQLATVDDRTKAIVDQKWNVYGFR
ncbi:menaquinone biosynthesis decarboxylase [Nitrososphaera sp. AFS]|uniref:menaquinone biosynthesis decarboxylase n=1 Tax=Nitrososphaera sp. AFS TaxID=2301191 RepID=UPI001392372C|nr:menaquinone biosynthesis decarboxylase [Nitrososphaera sp. AFS]NAL76824.1 menaquinone biosynthesis decarboxylase [Nitrososphaera sp. AFS]